MLENQMVLEVFGPERHGRVPSYGDGVTHIEIWGLSSFIVCDLEQHLKEFEEKRKESDFKVDSLEVQVNKVKSLLEKQATQV